MTKGAREMADAAFSAALAGANAIVAALNVSAYLDTGERRDLAAAAAWMGSTAYWLFRLAIGMVAA